MKPGAFYFIKDSFFEKVNDPYLKINHKKTKRPHYFVLEDANTSLYWLIPCSSKATKYESIIERKRKSGKPSDAIKIIKVHNRKVVLLFQDMFPITADYIQEPYIRNGQLVYVSDPKVKLDIEKTARKIIKLLRRGIRFTPTQPDVNRIERIMAAELQQVEVAATKELYIYDEDK